MTSTECKKENPLTTDDCYSRSISTIAVLDLELTNLPCFNFNKVGITELCIYAFDVNELKKKDVLISEEPAKLPETPRVIHKLNLLFNPRRMVHPDAEAVTGLNNYILEYESPLDENAASTIIGFLKHLKQPICLVAHNGWKCDFPIVKQAFDKLAITLSLPDGLLCVDSLRAFIEIDESIKNAQSMELTSNSEDQPHTSKNVEFAFQDLKEEKHIEIDWRRLNETTPKRPTISRRAAAVKRKWISDENDPSTLENTKNESLVKSSRLNARRALFAEISCHNQKRFPKGVYKLGTIYQRIFGKLPDNAHQAEVDVNMLTKLIQHYGIDFLAFAETQAIPFDEVQSL